MHGKPLSPVCQFRYDPSSGDRSSFLNSPWPGLSGLHAGQPARGWVEEQRKDLPNAKQEVRRDLGRARPVGGGYPWLAPCSLKPAGAALPIDSGELHRALGDRVSSRDLFSLCPHGFFVW